VKQKEAIKSMLQDCEKHQLLKVFTCSLDAHIAVSALKEYSICEICEICDFGTGQTLPQKEIVPGPYPVIGQGKEPIGLHEHFNCPAMAILCSSSGSSLYFSRYNTPVWVSDSFFLKVKDNTSETVDGEFLFYYLKAHQGEFYEQKTEGIAEWQNSLLDLLKYRVRLPHIDAQVLCVKEIKRYEQQKTHLQVQLEETQKLIQIFLQGDDNEMLRDVIEKSAQNLKKPTFRRKC
jgi:hypothetical protein